MNMSGFQEEWMRSQIEPKQILLVDDNADDCRVIQAMSREYNVTWVLAHGYEDAIKQVLARKFELIVIDLNLGPSKAGGEVVFEAVKKINPKAPVLILSGHLTTDVINRIYAIGYAQFIPKPKCFDREFFDQFFATLNIPKREIVTQSKSDETMVRT